MATIKVLVKDPGKAPVITEVENTLEAFQELIGGNIEAVTKKDGLVMLVDEEGKIKGLPANFKDYRLEDMIVGRAIFVGDAGDDFCDIQEQHKFAFTEILPVTDPLYWADRKEG